MLVRAATILFILCLFTNPLSGQDHEGKILLHYPKRSHQWDIGRSYFVMGNEHWSGVTLDLWSVLKKKRKWAFGFDHVAAGSEFGYANNGTALSRLKDYGMFFVKYERLIQPTKMIHFSTFCKAGFGGLTRDFVVTDPGNFSFYTTSASEEFLVVAPGANMLCNLYNNLAIGLGGQYRFTSSVKKIDFFNGAYPRHYAFSIFLRFTLPGTGKEYKGQKFSGRQEGF